MLSIQGVSKSFGGTHAVRDLNLTVQPGTIHAFMGPNGAGKTTTIKMCTGLLLPDTGEIHIAGHDVMHDGIEARRLLAYVPDEPYLYERLTAREFLHFTSQLYGLDDATYQQRSAEAIERFHLADFLDQLAEGFSHGMRQRVVLAAAYLHQPSLLIVDEPLVGLDPLHIRVVLDWLVELAAGGGAVLMSTHTLQAIEQIAHEVTVIRQGQAVFQGDLAALRADADLEERFLALTEQ